MHVKNGIKLKHFIFFIILTTNRLTLPSQFSLEKQRAKLFRSSTPPSTPHSTPVPYIDLFEKEYSQIVDELNIQYNSIDALMKETKIQLDMLKKEYEDIEENSEKIKNENNLKNLNVYIRAYIEKNLQELQEQYFIYKSGFKKLKEIAATIEVFFENKMPNEWPNDFKKFLSDWNTDKKELNDKENEILLAIKNLKKIDNDYLRLYKKPATMPSLWRQYVRLMAATFMGTLAGLGLTGVAGYLLSKYNGK